MPASHFMVRSAINNLINIGLGVLIPNFLNIESGMRFILDPRSHKSQVKLYNLIVHGTVKALGSSFFSTNDLEEITL